MRARERAIEIRDRLDGTAGPFRVMFRDRDRLVASMRRSLLDISNIAFGDAGEVT